MGGVLGGIGRGLLDILGGAHTLRRQQEEGFDWREKQAQADWQRRRERELAQQQDEELQQKREDKAASELSDIIAGSGEGEQPDLESMLPASIDNMRKKALIARAVGMGKERKSALAGQKYAADKERADAARQARLEVLARTQEGQKALQEERISAQREGRQASAEAAMDRLDKSLAARSSGGRGGGGKMRPLIDPATGLVAGFYNEKPGEGGAVQFQPPPEGAWGMRANAVPASIQENLAQAGGIASNLDTAEKNLAEHPEWFGPEAALGYKARAAQIPGKSLFLEPPTEERAANSSALASLKNRTVKEITGAQMSEHEVPRLMAEIPQEGDYPAVAAAKMKLFRRRMEVVNAVRSGRISREQGIQMIESMGPEGASRGPAAPKPGRRLRFNPATGQLE